MSEIVDCEFCGEIAFALRMRWGGEENGTKRWRLLVPKEPTTGIGFFMRGGCGDSITRPPLGSAILVWHAVVGWVPWRVGLSCLDGGDYLASGLWRSLRRGRSIRTLVRAASCGLNRSLMAWRTAAISVRRVRWVRTMCLLFMSSSTWARLSMW